MDDDDDGCSSCKLEEKKKEEVIPIPLSARVCSAEMIVNKDDSRPLILGVSSCFALYPNNDCLREKARESIVVTTSQSLLALVVDNGFTTNTCFNWSSTSFGIKNFGTAANLCYVKCFRLLHYIMMLPEPLKDRLRREHGLHCDIFSLKAVVPFLRCCNDYKIYLDIYNLFKSAFTQAKVLPDPLKEACLAGNIDIIKHLCTTVGFKADDCCLGRAFESPNTEGVMQVIQYLVKEQGVRKGLTITTMTHAFQTKRMDVIQFIFENTMYEAAFEKHILANASQTCNVEIIKYVEKMMVARGHVSSLQYIFSHPLKNDAMETLHYLAKKYPEGFNDQNVYIASSKGLEPIKYIHERFKEKSVPAKYYDVPHLVDSASSKGQLDVVKYMLEECRTPPLRKFMDTAAITGNLDIVEYFHQSTTVGCSKAAMDGAIKNGHLNVIQFLHNFTTEGGSPNIINIASQIGRLDIIKFMIENNRTEGFSGLAINWAIAQGRFDIAEYLNPHLPREKRATMSDAVVNAAHIGDVYWVDWAIREGYQLNPQDCMMAAIKNGHLGVVQYLVNHQDFKLSDIHIHSAVDDNGADILEFMIDTCKYNFDVTDQFFVLALDSAASKGHLNSIKFITTRYGPRWSANAVARSVYHAHMTTLVYLLEQKSDPSFLTYHTFAQAIQNACNHGHLHAVMFLCEYLCLARPDIDINKMFEKGYSFSDMPKHFHIVKYLVENGHVEKPVISKLVPSYERQNNGMDHDYDKLFSSSTKVIKNNNNNNQNSLSLFSLNLTQK
ncbi:hypothetical protein DFA_03279 [Cavenderia fasciculata]|uniref:Ankyrin repeat-containing protein n=1 Tax=Cavenderia fasciculata TaxID=261658 RepID=F4PH49_CACFS|nr:uncharacterized protein DFA_03279 [Cavenderia fasciculata]EGG25033.1 hypothetical protein DFA_03279 [Cavenderia fasciculata]|eukprot:XP_004362884.1 hypothetical protein DFA_03279 [Cavenderia fasciculata]